MGVLKEVITTNNFQVILGMGIIILVLFILNIISQFRISSITKKYDRLVKGMDAGSLESLILQHIDKIDKTSDDVLELKDFCHNLDDRLKFCIQKIGAIRYNAFSEMGSDLSFSIALLDEKLNGFVITSIYGRDESNTYAKPIIDGKSKYNLSEEEKQAIDRAIKNNDSESKKAKVKSI